MSRKETTNDTGSMSLPPEVILPGNMSLGSSKWNSSKLGLRLGADVASAAAASILITPIIYVIDRSIVEKTTCRETSLATFLKHNIQSAILRPHNFLTSKGFFLIFSLYTATYAASNSVDTVSSSMQNKPAVTTTSGGAKFMSTSAVNMSLCVYKDTQFVRMFGVPSIKPVPLLSRVLWTVRDSMTIFASFNMPSIIAPKLTELPPAVRERFSRNLSTESGRLNTAQFLTPAAVQIFSTPLHLLGIDLHNNQERLSIKNRFVKVAQDYRSSVLARIGRIVPAFGVGGVVNAKVRRDLMERLES